MTTRPTPVHQLFGPSSVLASRDDDADVELVRQCLDGNRRCFEELVERYEKVLFNLSLRMVGNYDDALDVTQSSFAKAYQRLSSFDRNRRFFSWIYRITVNESLNLVQRRRPQLELHDELAAPGNTPLEDLQAKELSEVVAKALTRITPEYRTVLVLRHFVGLSYRQMAETLEIEEKTVKSRLFTARRQMAELLLPERGDQ